MSFGANIKTPAEIESMRKSGKILAETLSHIVSISKVGMTTLELDQIAEEMILEAGGTPCFKGYNGYPFTLCTSLNDEVVHTMPSQTKLKEGDVLTIDGGVCFEGFNTDSCTTIVIGKNYVAENFVEGVRNILYGAIRLVKPGTKMGDIGHYIESEVNKMGHYVFRDLIGHGIGRKLHEPPEVPNFGKPGSGVALKPGMTFCIEPIIGFSTRNMVMMEDGW